MFPSQPSTSTARGIWSHLRLLRLGCLEYNKIIWTASPLRDTLERESHQWKQRGRRGGRVKVNRTFNLKISTAVENLSQPNSQLSIVTLSSLLLPWFHLLSNRSTQYLLYWVMYSDARSQAGKELDNLRVTLMSHKSLLTSLWKYEWWIYIHI